MLGIGMHHSALLPSSGTNMSNLLRDMGDLESPERIELLNRVQWAWRPAVETTCASSLPNSRVIKYIGRLSLHFIKESWAVREGGGLGFFFNEFLAETAAIARAHVTALGGNALLSHRLITKASAGKLFKNQVYYLISLSGDVALVQR
jgi:hypothetical protein